ncbi:MULTISPECIES: hypothetical protein [Prochlorococcus]|uniref:Uncharacterized protein n=1 Tax=Prochlorococcus marinus (strain SARG / CCMP1375 / SS120) TaxID=167539 RepID=Q7VAE7_PROMA|nr:MULTISPECIES: hypothetical protein [Prochlorococcus]AAQ00561.1 Predicted protein [Prochlorococcus marinus subsp. marinus str. CCMP1375]KGG10955.1 hypothetical protein EV04_1919 [Prochlorococcus marinus str. LG]KGG19954.1 hypothetical protein EV08_1186 [Prochlorococcus marinus str. SS2]KGG24204.1 hypothetical protein EV09_0811 [Prochlorococcus marinus str. SS35]KGG31539.1 hypothetical protein EV10_1632 [Prochlorococcus marinus str. SS51]
MSLDGLQTSIENISALQAILWCLYPMAVLVALEFLARSIDDDDDQGGGTLIPILEGAQ